MPSCEVEEKYSLVPVKPRADRQPPGRAGRTIDSDRGDPRDLIDAVALILRLQNYALGDPSVQMYEGQLNAARMLLDRAVPAQQQLAIASTVRHIAWDDRLAELSMRLVGLLERRGE
ncbi:MAG TPA: hypothetical protein VMF89_13750 [Polyangiales bacterium]|nr:hypothetical protein [Polyangiales bacterium]